MNVVFMGTPEFAVPSLLALIASHDVVAVYTQPDRPAGRGRKLVPSAVKLAAEQHCIAVRQPSSLKDPGEWESLADLHPDVVCVAAYGLLLPQEVLDIPRMGCVNVHASLLPLYRGAAPVHRAILAGDRVAGVSIMRMEAGLDTGPYATVRSVEVGNSTVDELTMTLARLGAEALLETLDALGAGHVDWVAQDDARATYAAKITREDVALSPDLRVEDVLRRVRASTRRAPSRACLDGRNVTVVRALAAPDVHLQPQAISTSGDRLLVGVADGTVEFSEIRPEGRADMEGACWARGARLTPDACWTEPE